MKYTFFHVSDLHYKSDWPEETDLVCNKFIEDITIQMKNFENPYLVFSGDLVVAGEDSGLYSEFQSNFAKALDNAGFPRERRICTPGNHDISQNALKPLLTIQKGTLSEIKDEETFNDQLAQLSKSIFSSKFENYVSCETKFAHHTCCHSGLGGTGWDLQNGIGLYCLNTAICSFGGLHDLQGKPISDKGHLMIDTRSLHRWLADTKFTKRILVMHHPLEWLADWAKCELDKIIATNFQLVFSGHRHMNSAICYSLGNGRTLHCAAPPLFTHKSETLGYAFINMDTEDGAPLEVSYRQWSSMHKFVAGTGFAGNDTGTLTFPTKEINDSLVGTPSLVLQSRKDTLDVLQAEFDEAITSYVSKKKIWVGRDLANLPETDGEREKAVMTTLQSLCLNLRSCIIRAPKQFGLTCVGRFIALEYHRQSATGKTVAMVDTTDIPAHRRGAIEYIENRCKEISTQTSSLAGIILDNWYNDKQARRVWLEIRTKFPSLPIILLQCNEDSFNIVNAIETEQPEQFETLYLWSLTRSQIREMVVAYTKDLDSLDDDLVTKKIINDIDALNIHRTPINCLLILKLAEQAFDDSPVNRTEMIGRVLYLLFYQYDKIPRYATRPDLKDCEYALGYVCEWLIRSGKKTFAKNEFYEKVQEYCSAQIIDLDCEVLFAFLFTENILIRKGFIFEFRFSYWLYFFAAHRMHHNSDFAQYILSDHRYSAFPEMVEFYTGIDRRRSDAVIRLAEDLKKMNSDFLERTKIMEDFNPYQFAIWSPDEKVIEEMKRHVDESLAESALPISVKDVIADKNYDRARPYNQELAKFINESSLIQMVQAMKGAARALRNSDHVSPSSKMDLLQDVISCWKRVCQILFILSLVLAERKRAAFEGMGFILDKSFDDIDSPEMRWQVIMSVVAENVVNWFQEDLFSKKMGAMFSRYIQEKQGELGEFLIQLVLTKQRPPGWEKEVEYFIIRNKKNSFYLHGITESLHTEFKISFCNEQTRQQLRRLTAMAAAKHFTGSKEPNKKLIEKAAEELGLNSMSKSVPQIVKKHRDKKEYRKYRKRHKKR